MATCGIERFDRLPSRIGLTDIDAMRAAVSIMQKDIELTTKKQNELITRLEKISSEYYS